MRKAMPGLAVTLLALSPAMAEAPWPFPWPESRIAHYTALRTPLPIAPACTG